MNLNEYLFYTKLTRIKFAEMLDIDRRYAGNIVLGQKVPGRKLKKKIAEITNGMFPIEYWDSQEYLDYCNAQKNSCPHCRNFLDEPEANKKSA